MKLRNLWRAVRTSCLAPVLGTQLLLLLPVRALAGPLDLLCSESTRAAAVVPESLLGTPEPLARVVVGKERTDTGSPGTVAIFVRVRKCPMVEHEEYETWVDAEALDKGASSWVHLFGSVSTRERTVWLVGKPESGNTNQAARAVLGGTPERRMIRLHFHESRRAEIEAGRVGGIQVSSPMLKWYYIRKGEGLTGPGGERRTFPEDLVGPDVTLTFTNRTSDRSAAGYPNDFFLAGKGNVLIAGPLRCDKCTDLGPGESRTVTLVPHVRFMSQVSKFGPLYLVNVQTGLSLPMQQPK